METVELSSECTEDEGYLLGESDENWLLELELRPVEFQFEKRQNPINQSQHSTHFILFNLLIE